MDAIRAAQGDLGVGVDGVVGYVIGAGGYELDELDVGYFGCFLREPGDGNQDIDTFQEFWRACQSDVDVEWWGCR